MYTYATYAARYEPTHLLFNLNHMVRCGVR